MTKARDNATQGGLVLLTPGSATNGTIGSSGNISFSGASTILINNCFNSTYKSYKVITDLTAASTSLEIFFRLSASGTAYSGALYSFYGNYGRTTGASGATYASGANQFYLGNTDATYAPGFMSSLEIHRPFLTQYKSINFQNWGKDSTSQWGSSTSGVLESNTSYDGLYLYTSTGTITGSIKVYGYK